MPDTPYALPIFMSMLLHHRPQPHHHMHNSPLVPHRGISCIALSLHNSSLIKPSRDLFRLSLVRVEAIRKVLAVLVACVVGQHLAAGGALERLEAGFALDALGGYVLYE